jgi:hypothetical protein
MTVIIRLHPAAEKEGIDVDEFPPGAMAMPAQAEKALL